MKFVIEIETSNEKMKECIVAALNVRFGDDDNVLIKDVKDFAIGDEVIKTDMDNIFKGSSIGQLMSECGATMTRIE